ncbi:ATP-binding protein [Anaerosphaera multitolerans]|uniref:ATP-binding protein n=1 Tax=Anaerosphaera multitolerans TaxID=2487351 RepID=A0A437S573_9FIRM|nr:ATP-binding protein [Anaerosphaera multitolerans]RVU54117.1 ATP-binding protein [Anaerosphaera multitolerans]
MKVLGITTQQEVYIGSRDRNFRINEFLIISDEAQGDLIGEIVEAKTFNRFIPLDMGGDFIDGSVIESLKVMGYDVSNETIYIGKLRLLKEAQYPVLTGSEVRIPKFEEVEKLLISTEPSRGLVLGVIKNTDDLTLNMDEKYLNLCKTFDEGEYFKQKDVPFILDYKSMHEYPHIGVFGGSGSGKSFGLRVVLEEIMQKQVPTVVLDPHYEMDFSVKSPAGADIDYGESFKCLQVGVDVGIKFEELSVGDIKNLLNTSSPLTDSMNNTVDILFVRGSNYYSFFNKLQNLMEAQEVGSVEKIEEKIFYAETKEDEEKWTDRKNLYQKYNATCPNQSVRGILWRLVKLFNEGIFNRDITELVDGLKVGKLIVIQGSTRIIQVFATYLLNKLYYQRREYRESVYRNEREDFFPPFIIVTDEAHNFAPKGFETPSKSILREIAQEGRKYGVFLILATQRPTLLDETITAQLNTKFIFRTVRASDIDTIREETDIATDEAKRLPYLTTGDVFISSAKAGRTSYVRIRASHTQTPHKENPFDELALIKSRDNEDFLKYISEFMPISTAVDSLDIIKSIYERHSVSYTIDQFNLKLKELEKNGLIEVEETFLGAQYKLKKN